MTIYQIQCLLAYLGFYTARVDGIWGEASALACIQFQQDYGLELVDGICGPDTEKALRDAVANGMPERKPETPSKPESGDFWDEIQYFTRAEFRCTCGRCGGFPVEPEEKLVRTVDEIRRRLGVPVSIVDSGGSGIRCKAHNAEVGGVYNSEHLFGRAADLHCRGKTPSQMKAVAESVMGKTGGIGLYDWGIHVDTGKYSRWNG